MRDVFLCAAVPVGALAAAIPIVLHLLKREPEARVKFAAVQLLQQRAGRAHRAAAPARAAAAGAARRGAAAAGAGVRAAVLRRPAQRPASAASTRRGARHVAQHVGAGPLRAREAAGEGGDRARARRRPGRRRHIRRRRRDRGEAVGGSRRWRWRPSIAPTPGFGATRYRAALSAAAQTLGGRAGTIVVVTDLQESGWDAGDRASVPESARSRDRRCRRAAAEPRGHGGSRRRAIA